MKYLFTPDGLRLLDAFCFKQSLFAFDFDGTLAPIVRSPEDARASARSSALLSKLTKYAPTAIISGRGLSDLRSRIDVAPRFLVGNHGLEGLRAKNGAGVLAKETSALWRLKLEQVLLSEAVEGIELEDKKYSLAVHYRKCRNKQSAREAIEEALDRLRPLPRIILGKQVFNLIPQGAPHKGVALTELMTLTGTSSALFIGDDDTDEDVFSLPDDRILGIRVGYNRKSQAKYFIRRQSEVARLLERLVGSFESLVTA